VLDEDWRIDWRIRGSEDSRIRGSEERMRVRDIGERHGMPTELGSEDRGIKNRRSPFLSSSNPLIL
jgi:hypothetical protein